MKYFKNSLTLFLIGLATATVGAKNAAAFGLLFGGGSSNSGGGNQIDGSNDGGSTNTGTDGGSGAPEPASMLLLAAGATVLGVRSLKRPKVDEEKE